ncbi:lipopolysaccharide biosynthesis glycosyltransferase [Providencia alcalifaciens]|nr:lipopolysaccharide biosynthesis glycosyltransferase [Providencia alcalifaciens]
MHQDALNITLTGKVKFIDKKYNSQFSINYELKKDKKTIINNNAILIHYIGLTKPWHSWGEYKST